MTEELLYSRAWRSEDDRAEHIAAWNVHYDYHRPHGAVGGKPPAAGTAQRVTKLLSSYS